LRIFRPQPRFSARILGLALLAALAAVPVAMPRAAVAQSSPNGQQKSAAAPAQANSQATEAKQSESEEDQLLNSKNVQTIARVLHLSVPTARTIFLIINFAIIFLAIVIPLFRFMPKVLRKRSETVRHGLETARKASEEARQRMSAVEAKLAGLDKEIAAFRAQVEQDSLEDEKRIQAALKEDSERIVAAAEQEIGAAAAHARRTLQRFAADLAVERATQQVALTPEADRALIHEFIGQVAATDGAKGGK